MSIIDKTDTRDESRERKNEATIPLPLLLLLATSNLFISNG